MINTLRRMRFTLRANVIDKVPALHNLAERWRTMRGYVTDAELDEYNRWVDCTVMQANTSMHRENGHLPSDVAEIYDIAVESGASVTIHNRYTFIVAHFAADGKPEDITDITDSEILAHTGGFEPDENIVISDSKILDVMNLGGSLGFETSAAIDEDGGTIIFLSQEDTSETTFR